MKNFWKRLGSAGVATALCLGMAQAVPAAVVSAADPLFSAECEDLTLSSDAQVEQKSIMMNIRVIPVPDLSGSPVPAP